MRREWRLGLAPTMAKPDSGRTFNVTMLFINVASADGDSIAGVLVGVRARLRI